ncbi:hypothetical protein [Butyrivibrio fibrisolvens]|uniref:hypothetical protein n=1 Tax=Butyrivibrio fibrisolvens TaxID=831 RepID=UPI0012BD33A4|nr:hypothetical protein [Butyrivibrio fibrisolvens]
MEKRMRKNKLFTITIICLGLVTACTDQGNDNLKGNKSAIEDTGNSLIEEKADAADSKKTDAVLDSPLKKLHPFNDAKEDKNTSEALADEEDGKDEKDE